MGDDRADDGGTPLDHNTIHPTGTPTDPARQKGLSGPTPGRRRRVWLGLGAGGATAACLVCWLLAAVDRVREAAARVD
jgi:hypothetical protein